MISVLRLCRVSNRNVIKRISYRQSSTAVTKLQERLKTGPNLNEFLVVGKNLPIPGRIKSDKVPYINPIDLDGSNRKVFFEVYGCQMNVSDTEIVWSILQNSGYSKTDDIKMADVILVVTCAIREGAEKKIWNRLRMLAEFKNTRSINHGPLQIGVLGCMAERIKTKFLEEEKIVDIVAGPDSYKDLPRLLAITKTGPRAVNTLLSLDETYADVLPVRLDEKKITAFVSIMRGCDNMCTYCIVPFTRGRERSRPVESLINEVKHLANQGVKEITLLGQNVNSYRDVSQHKDDRETDLVDGFKTVYKHKKGGLRFGRLLELVATAVPDVRIRFTSPHPKDFPDDVLYAIRNHNNVCKSIHLPAQSGNSEVLERMRRGYSREAYLKLVEHIRNILPNVALSSDFICGFCGETEEEFTDTESLISIVKYNVAYLFEYSMREKTTAHRRFKDDVPGDVKNERLKRMVSAFREGASELNAKFIGEKQLILIEDFSKRSKLEVYGRNDANIKVIVPIESIPKTKNSSEVEQIKAGDFIAVRVTETNSQVLKGIPLYHTSISEFYNE